MEATWSTLKTFIDTYSVPVHWIDLGNMYYLKAFEGKFEVDCYLLKSSVDDTADFETNYKASGNKPAKSNVVQVLGKDTLSLYPFGALLQPTAGTTTNCDIQIPYTTVLKGGVLYSTDAVVGDNVSLSIVDKDNVLGLGGTPEDPTILGSYVLSWYIIPGEQNSLDDVSISESLPQGLYVRVSYTSVGNVSPKVIFNFIAYKSIS